MGRGVKEELRGKGGNEVIIISTLSKNDHHWAMVHIETSEDNPVGQFSVLFHRYVGYED